MYKFILWLLPGLRRKIEKQIRKDIGGRLMQDSYWFNSYPEVRSLIAYYGLSITDLGYCNVDAARKHYESECQNFYGTKPTTIERIGSVEEITAKAFKENPAQLYVTNSKSKHTNKQRKIYEDATGISVNKDDDNIVRSVTIDLSDSFSSNNNNDYQPPQDNNDNNNSFGGGDFGGGGAGGDY